MDTNNHITITATKPTLKYFTVYFAETEHQTIIATYQFKDYLKILRFLFTLK